MARGLTASAGEAEPVVRCPWAGTDPLMVAYHDDEWGVPCHEDDELWERLVLEWFQAGLSWATILRKRPAFRAAFSDPGVEAVASYGDDDVTRLMADAGIVRNRAKILATIGNAQAFIALRDEHGTFDHWLWGRSWDTTGDQPGPRPAVPGDVPADTPASRALSKALKARGFRFVGPTICYAFMQSVGLVDDHLANCFRAN
ncbi:MAG TPA: DNA-3-methyladenine glycosylase I [Thermomicrobiales bacterium]|nr:DNA-3-methyladenine glycosylase I [Thermomicrobiales bacterium]